MLTMSKVTVSVQIFSPSAKDTGIAFFPKASIFFPPKPNSEFLAGCSVHLSRFICSKGLMKRMSAELPLSTRMLCTVNLAMFAIATKASVCRKSRTWKTLSSKVIVPWTKLAY